MFWERERCIKEDNFPSDIALFKKKSSNEEEDKLSQTKTKKVKQVSYQGHKDQLCVKSFFIKD